MKRLLLALVLAVLPMAAYSGTPPLDYYTPTGIAPAFFGPNAFPVPDMMTGRTSADFKFEAYADSIWGTAAEGDE